MASRLMRDNKSVLIDGKDARRMLMALVSLAYLAGYLVRPDTVTSDRSGYAIVMLADTCKTVEDCLALGLPSGFYGFINLLSPFGSLDLLQWDALLAAVGFFVIVSFAFSLSNNVELSVENCLFFLAATALCSMYIFMLSKDFIQILIFLLAFLLVARVSSARLSICLVIALFIMEGLLWRPYFYIVAFFLAIFYIGINRLISKPLSKQRFALFFCAFVGTLFIFAYALHAISPEDYAEIAYQHGEAREEFTTTSAATGIKSLFSITPQSPVALFVINWLVNTFRLFLPLELFGMGLYYWPFAIYQLYVSAGVLRLLSSPVLSGRQVLCVALYSAFLLASGAFEPDFGSWVRHETACLPFLLVVTGALPLPPVRGHVVKPFS